MENEEKKCCESGGYKQACQGGSCCGKGMMMSGHGCHGGKHFLIKVILKLIIIMMIFCFGFKLGQITGAIRGGDFGERGSRSGYRMMRGGYDYSGYAPDVNVQNVAPTTPPAKQ